MMVIDAKDLKFEIPRIVHLGTPGLLSKRASNFGERIPGSGYSKNSLGVTLEKFLGHSGCVRLALSETQRSESKKP